MSIYDSGAFGWLHSPREALVSVLASATSTKHAVEIVRALDEYLAGGIPAPALMAERPHYGTEATKLREQLVDVEAKLAQAETKIAELQAKEKTMTVNIKSSRRLRRENRRCDRCGGHGAGRLPRDIGPYKAGTYVCGKCLGKHQPKPVKPR